MANQDAFSVHLGRLRNNRKNGEGNPDPVHRPRDFAAETGPTQRICRFDRILSIILPQNIRVRNERSSGWPLQPRRMMIGGWTELS
ncbi:hypothetical protein SeMB42_g00033 [Synchytrium endobioticum]|uniref:Uncharacterized protein n=1 Tax=Synchytrium endobioticum TaxID=286115 RepID=A0A507DU86_9FUNG|nr:hypothetical protein SeMB42_g00033 [Synchytrium endobioticum]